jgi:hypothetical protein
VPHVSVTSELARSGRHQGRHRKPWPSDFDIRSKPFIGNEVPNSRHQERRQRDSRLETPESSLTELGQDCGWSGQAGPPASRWATDWALGWGHGLKAWSGDMYSTESMATAGAKLGANGT